MLKIYTKNCKEKLPLSIQYTEKKITFSMSTDKWEYDITDIEAENMYKLFICDDEFNPVLLNVEYSLRDSSMDTIRIYKGPDNQIFISTTHPVVATEGNEIFQVGNDFKLRRIIAKIYNHTRSNKKYMTRMHMVDVLDPNISISVLDAQLEIVTKLLLPLLDRNRENMSEEDEALLDELKEAFNNTSLFNIKKSSKIMDEVKETKKRIRKMQETFYNYKS